ncbi:hypothetical protein ASPZODRAFT_137133 [Penicilliopsis zonata CBS 506.65]|uniref:Uncharacterized protein n=1 Tax=Penicilliopsis zonata CBS 506.65 TaxID=1073090 RepID=A0A1L9S6F1_9EURO|nr:hypothetical protein ASPZODRAFT_137133 [Penicilliopsis zonata CBS 506.65]OJJ42739.1 hypothetical protein ASPZODRAFT_137133 [Penicilliopsis zonata CBS 506.65]
MKQSQDMILSMLTSQRKNRSAIDAIGRRIPAAMSCVCSGLIVAIATIAATREITVARTVRLLTLIGINLGRSLKRLSSLL